MKTGECIKFVNPDIKEFGSVDWLTIWKEGKGEYKVVLEKSSRLRSKVIKSSAEIRKIMKLAEQNGYKRQGGSDVKFDEESSTESP